MTNKRFIFNNRVTLSRHPSEIQEGAYGYFFLDMDRRALIRFNNEDRQFLATSIYWDEVISDTILSGLCSKLTAKCDMMSREDFLIRHRNWSRGKLDEMFPDQTVSNELVGMIDATKDIPYKRCADHSAPVLMSTGFTTEELVERHHEMVAALRAALEQPMLPKTDRQIAHAYLRAKFPSTLTKRQWEALMALRRLHNAHGYDKVFTVAHLAERDASVLRRIEHTGLVVVDRGQGGNPSRYYLSRSGFKFTDVEAISERQAPAYQAVREEMKLPH